jgi:hypothetical protein
MRQSFGRHSFSLPVLADIEILAEDTSEVAAGEKDRAGAAHAHQRRFLAEVRPVARYDRMVCYAAGAYLAAQAAGSARARTHATRLKQVLYCVDAPLQFPALMKL